jgi:hypothetical protein
MVFIRLLYHQQDFLALRVSEVWIITRNLEARDMCVADPFQGGVVDIKIAVAGKIWVESDAQQALLVAGPLHLAAYIEKWLREQAAILENADHTCLLEDEQAARIPWRCGQSKWGGQTAGNLLPGKPVGVGKGSHILGRRRAGRCGIGLSGARLGAGGRR